MATDAAATFASRSEQLFPVLTEAEIAQVGRFGRVRSFSRNQRLFSADQPAAGMFVVLSGVLAISQRDGRGCVLPVVRQARGQFSGEIALLSGRYALTDGVAEEDLEAILLTPDELRALIIAEADLGERIVRALILRRVGLLKAGASGPVLMGSPGTAHLMRLQNFLTRNDHPYRTVDPAVDADAATRRAHFGISDSDVMVVFASGTVLLNPTDTEMARHLGMVDSTVHDELYDVAVVGAGPAGLATAVYAASEGLKVVVTDCRSHGGQAGSSTRIENYLGFPTGISGQALAARAFIQAQKFGAQMMIPAEVAAIDCRNAGPGGEVAIHLKDERRLRSKSVVIASGARYRRPAIDRLGDFEGKGVWYWASAIEANTCANEQVVLVGGGNSAGQAAVFLSRYASKVHVLVRGDGLARTMSRYLIDRLGATPNIELHPYCELTELRGDPSQGLAGVSWRDGSQTSEVRRPIRHVFLFVGADPETRWLAGCGIALDKNGFVLTGPSVPRARATDQAGQLESNIAGVFAVGDVRSGSVKRVGSAIGEGAAAVASIHRFLAGRESGMKDRPVAPRRDEASGVQGEEVLLPPAR